MAVRNKLFNLFIILFLTIFILLTPQISAQNYYADIEITIDEKGVVDIEGISNHPNLITQNTEEYTYKKQSYWLLNITKEEVFSDYIYSLNLPEGTKINYIDASGFNGIEEENGRLIIAGSGNNEKLSIAVQYQIDETSEELSMNDYVLWIFLFLIITLTILLIYFIIEDKTKEKGFSKDKNQYNLKGLNIRQKEIMKLLINKNRPLTQTDIQKELDIPKAAVSRNVHSLEIKDLVEIEKTGMSNLIRLKKH
mgnify:CR=1 FL=1